MFGEAKRAPQNLEHQDKFSILPSEDF